MIVIVKKHNGTIESFANVAYVNPTWLTYTEGATSKPERYYFDKKFDYRIGVAADGGDTLYTFLVEPPTTETPEK